MTTPAHAQADTHAAPDQQLTSAFARALGQAVSAQTNKAWTGRALPAAQQAPAEASTTTVTLRLSGDLGGDLFLSLQPQASAGLLASLGTAAAQDPAQAWLTLCTAAQEILLASTNLPVAAFAIQSCQLATLPHTGEPLAAIELTDPQGLPGARVTVAADIVLRTHLARLQTDALRHTNAPEQDEVEPSAQIDRVIDVPLAVTLRFGQRHLTLREVLALNSGSLVELDRQVEEPVDLVLGDRLIARGEVVIVDGNYGLRVTEVVQGAANRIRRAQATLPAADRTAAESATA